MTVKVRLMRGIAPTGYLFAFRDPAVVSVRCFNVEFVLIFLSTRARTDASTIPTIVYAIPRWRPRSGYGAVRPETSTDGDAEQRDPIPRVPAAAPPPRPRATGDERQRDEAPTVRAVRAQPAARADPRSPVRVNSHPRPRAARRSGDAARPRAGVSFGEQPTHQSSSFSNRAERREQIIQRHVNTLQVPIVTHACSVC